MSLSITLTKDQTAITLPAPSGTIAARLVRRQALGRAAGGTVYTYDKGIVTREATLRLESLTDTEKEDLAAFFADTAAGALNTFTYTDDSGNGVTARFLDPTLEFEKVAGNVWDVRLRLELDAMAQ